jgi:hypothetical protein
MWQPQRLTTLWAFTACYRDSFTFFYCVYEISLFYSVTTIGRLDTPYDQFHNRHMQDTTLLQGTQTRRKRSHIPTYLQANKTHTTSIRDQEEPPKNTLVEETHLHTSTTSKQNIRKPFIFV